MKPNTFTGLRYQDLDIRGLKEDIILPAVGEIPEEHLEGSIPKRAKAPIYKQALSSESVSSLSLDERNV